MELYRAMLRAERHGDYTNEELDEAFDALCGIRDDIQDAIRIISAAKAKRISDEVDALRAAIGSRLRA